MKNKNIMVAMCIGALWTGTAHAIAVGAACDCTDNSYMCAQNCTKSTCTIHDCDGILYCATKCCTGTSWTIGAGFYQSRKYCQSAASEAITQYRCVPGYYGPNEVTYIPTCTQCPSSGGIAGQSAAGSTKITDCYIPAGTAFSDDYGSGTYTSDCYYTE